MDSRWAPLGSPFFTKDKRESLFRVAVAGELKVHWPLEPKLGPNGAVGGEVLGGRNASVVVEDVAGEQIIRAPLKAKALADLVKMPPFNSGPLTFSA